MRLLRPFGQKLHVGLFVAAAFCLAGQFFTATGIHSAEPSTYYVSFKEGEDSNPGNDPEKPWKSLRKVNATLFEAGDLILFRAGEEWAGQLWPKGSGREGSLIRIGRYGEGAKPAIRGNCLAEDAILLKNQEYWEVSDLNVSNHGCRPGIRRGVHIALENFGEAHSIILRRITVHDVEGLDSTKQNGGVIYTSVGNRKPSRFIDLRIEDNEIFHAGRNGISGWSDTWQRSRWYPSLGVVVRGNKLEDIGGDGIMIVATDGALIENNVVGKANQRSVGYNVAIWSWSADNTVIQYNEAWGTKGERDGEGFDSDWNSRNTIIQYNYSHDNEGGFVLICNEGGHDAKENIGNLNTILRYNISQNDKNRGITLSGPVKNTQIYNNTIFVRDGLRSDIVLFTNWQGWPQKTEFFNNIYYVQGEARIGHAISRLRDGHHVSAAGFGKSRDTLFGANVYFGQLNRVADAKSLTEDPDFISAGQGTYGRETLSGYTLQNDSKARGTGLPISQDGGKDFFGRTLAGCSSPDRGAVQSSSCDAR